jgi:trimethyllysine dioxygenase
MLSYTTDSAHDQEHSNLVLATSVLTETLLQVQFSDSSFTYHAQWLHDARNNRNPSRSAQDAFMVHMPDACILKAAHEGVGAGAVVAVSWTNGTSTRFPGAWLRVFGPLVAKTDNEAEGDGNTAQLLAKHRGWTTETIKIPSIDYNLVFPQENPTYQQQTAITVKIVDMMFHEGRSGIFKIVNLPPADVESERNRQNTLVTKILRQLFGAVFVHPRRAPDESFNISSDYGRDKLRGAELHNYQTEMLLLPHCDHAHYDVCQLHASSICDSFLTFFGSTLPRCRACIA